MSNQIKFEPSEYSICVKLEDFDGEKLYVAKVKELPDIEEYADSFLEAYSLALDSIKVAFEFFNEKGMKFPLPIDSKVNANSSGRLTLRLAKSLHSSLITRAENEGVSLNSYIVCVLASNDGAANATDSFKTVMRDYLDSAIDTNVTRIVESGISKVLFSYQSMFKLVNNPGAISKVEQLHVHSKGDKEFEIAFKAVSDKRIYNRFSQAVSMGSDI